MLFPTVDFAIFFVLVFVGHWLLNHLAQPWKWFMIAASYVFYAWWDWRFVLLLVGISVLAQLGAIAVSKTRTPRARLVVNGIAVTLLLLPLAFFKYYGFFAVNVTNTLTSFGMDSSIPLIQVVLPVGISFFTFMAIAYVVDVFRGDFEVAGWTDVFLYLSFFPHLVAGPIVRPGELIPQIQERRDERHVDVAGAAWMILGGLFKKVVVSSYLAAQIVDPVFGDPFTRSAPDALFAILGYAIVIYADFSGYTDIAIGIAKLLGFRFPKNFDRPYAATLDPGLLATVAHDALSLAPGLPLHPARREPARNAAHAHQRLRDDAPRRPLARSRLDVRVLGRVPRRRCSPRSSGDGSEPRRTKWTETTGGSTSSVDVPPTFALVCVGWVFFRADSLDTAFALLRRLFTGWFTPSEFVNPLVVFTIAGMLALQFWPRGLGLWLQSGLSRLKPAPLGVVLGLALLVIVILGPPGVAPFIYFQF